MLPLKEVVEGRYSRSLLCYRGYLMVLSFFQLERDRSRFLYRFCFWRTIVLVITTCNPVCLLLLLRQTCLNLTRISLRYWTKARFHSSKQCSSFATGFAHASAKRAKRNPQELRQGKGNDIENNTNFQIGGHNSKQDMGRKTNMRD